MLAHANKVLQQKLLFCFQKGQEIDFALELFGKLVANWTKSDKEVLWVQ